MKFIFSLFLIIISFLTFGQKSKEKESESSRFERVNKQTLSDTLLCKMTDSILSNHYPNIHSVLIAKGDSLVYEQYFNGYQRNSLHDSRSSFKSITSLLVGIAIDKGFIKNVDQPVYKFFPEYPLLKKDKLKRTLSIRNLLEMKSGFDCEEFNNTKDCEEAMSSTQDWVKYALGLKIIGEPGKKWSYTSINPVILSGLIRNATHMSMMDFADKYLFAPLGITDYKWTIDPSGNGMTAGSFYIRPLDMLKIGQLIKRNGLFGTKQIISAQWIKQSTLCNTPIPDFSFMKSSKTKFALPQQTYYGYYWYKEMVKTAEIEENVIFASGNGGQFIFLIPGEDLTVVFTQGNYGSWKAKQAFEILARYILPNYKH